MVRNIGAVIAGLIAGMAVNMAIIMLNSYVLYPMPEGTEFSDTEAMAAYIETLPVPALLVAMLAHLGQAFVGGWVAARLALTKPMALAMTIGVLSLAGGIYNLAQLPTPAWFMIELPLYLVAAWMAGSMACKRRAGAN